MNRDRNDHYVPDGLELAGPVRHVEIREPLDGAVELTPTGRLAHGQPDELNRMPDIWWWADTSPDSDGSHWSHYCGHDVQVDVQLSTANNRVVSHWKGRDEIRAGGSWTLALNRQPCWEAGFVDPLEALLTIRRTTQQLIQHVAIDWRSPTLAAEQLAGRPVFYLRTPAVIARVHLDQGHVVLEPDGVDEFPPAAWALNEPDPETADEDRDHALTTLLDPNIYWWRDIDKPDPTTPDPSVREKS